MIRFFLIGNKWFIQVKGLNTESVPVYKTISTISTLDEDDPLVGLRPSRYLEKIVEKGDYEFMDEGSAIKMYYVETLSGFSAADLKEIHKEILEEDEADGENPKDHID